MLKVNDFKDVTALIEKRDKVRMKVANGLSKNNLFFRCDYDETELYLKESFPKKLIISRIAFKNKRQGIGSAVLELLKKYCLEQGYSSIIVESTLTIEMIEFCKKHEFEPMEGQVFLSKDGELYGNYELELKDIT